MIKRKYSVKIRQPHRKPLAGFMDRHRGPAKGYDTPAFIAYLADELSRGADPKVIIFNNSKVTPEHKDALITCATLWPKIKQWETELKPGAARRAKATSA